MQAEVSPNSLKLTYPNGTADSVFTFFVSPSLLQPNVRTWQDIQGVNISISGNMDEEFKLDFVGRYGGTGGYEPYYDHNYWRFEHKMPDGFEGTPEMTISFD